MIRRFSPSPATASIATIVAAGVLAFAALACTAGVAHATGGDRIPGSRYVSGRGAALGDAYIGFADTIADSLFYNPAGLGKVKELTLEPLNLQLQTNSGLASGFGTGVVDFQSLEGYEKELVGNPRTPHGAGYALLPAFGFRGFGAGLLYQSRQIAEYDGTNLRYRTVRQVIPSVGFGLRLASGVLRLGYSLQWVNQVSGDRTVASGTRPLGWNEGMSEGQGFSHTLGLALTLPYVYNPSINLVARNLAGMRFRGKPLMLSASNPAGGIAPEKTSIDASVGWITKLSPGWMVATQFAYRDALDVSDTRALSHAAIGFEFTALEQLFLRVGFGSGFPSAGIGVRTSRAEANFAWYSEDLGDGQTAGRDVRYLFQLIFRAF